MKTPAYRACRIAHPSSHLGRGALALGVICSLVTASASLGQDHNANSIEGPRDLRLGTSPVCNHNGFVDERVASDPHFTQAIEHLNALEGEQYQNNVWDAQPIDSNNDGRRALVVSSMYATNTGAISFWRNEGGAGLLNTTSRAHELQIPPRIPLRRQRS